MLEFCSEGNMAEFMQAEYVNSNRSPPFFFLSLVTYPVPESISSCVIWSMVTAFMLVFSVMIDALRAGPDANPPNNMTNSIIAMTVVSAVGYIPVIWLDGDLKRLAVDGSQKKNSSNAWANEQVVQLNV